MVEGMRTRIGRRIRALGAIRDLEASVAEERAARIALERDLAELAASRAADATAREALHQRLEDTYAAEVSAREALHQRLEDTYAAEVSAREALHQRLDGFEGPAARRLHRVELAITRIEQSSSGAPLPASLPRASAGAVSDGLDDRVYLAIEDALRGSAELVTERQTPYADLMRDQLGHGASVVDIGCGRGEFLDLLAQRGLKPIGIDTNQGAIDEVRALGHPAECASAMDYLAGLRDGYLDGACLFHVVEHMTAPEVVALLAELNRTLRPGGILVLETPNPENLRVGAHTFWLDPTHVRPFPPALLELLVRATGFEGIESLRLHPYPGYSEEAEECTRGLLGPQDFGIVARRSVSEYGTDDGEGSEGPSNEVP